MSGLQTRTYTLAGQSFTAGTFVNLSSLMGSTQSTTNPENMRKIVRISLSATPQMDSSTDGISIWKMSGDGVSVQQIFSGPGWSCAAAGPLGGNNGQPVVMESSTGLFEIVPGNQIDFSCSVTTAETLDVSISITYSA